MIKKIMYNGPAEQGPPYESLNYAMKTMGASQPLNLEVGSLRRAVFVLESASITYTRQFIHSLKGNGGYMHAEISIHGGEKKVSEIEERIKRISLKMSRSYSPDSLGKKIEDDDA